VRVNDIYKGRDIYRRSLNMKMSSLASREDKSEHRVSYDSNSTYMAIP
jgi:hypothetical protein